MSKRFVIRLMLIGLLNLLVIGPKPALSFSQVLGRHEECVDCPNEVGAAPYALNVDAQGYLRLVIGSDYYWQDARGWHRERTQPDDARSDSLTFDSNGFPRFIYITPGQVLGYAYKDWTGWHHEDIYLLGKPNWSNLFYPSLYVDPSGNPHIAFLSDLSVRYAYKDSSGWHVIEAFYRDDLGCQSLTPFAVDPSGNFHLAAKCSLNSYLLTWNGAAWTATVLPLYVEPHFMFYDHNGYIHIIFNNTNMGQVYLAQDANGWQQDVQVIDPNNGEDGTISAVVDRNEFIRFSFYDSTDKVIKVAQQKSAGSWEVTALPGGVNLGISSSLDLDPEDHSSIVYTEIDPTDQALGSLEYAYSDQSGWHSQLLWQNDWFNRVHSMALDANGNPAVVYRSARKGLLYAVRGEQGWSEEIVDTGRNSGLHMALAFGPDGNPQMVYTVMSQNVNYFKYAIKKNNQWLIQDIPNAIFDEDDRPSLQIDPSNFPHLVLNVPVGLNHEPRYYSFDGNQWTYEVIQSPSPAGLYQNTLRLDASGRPHIVSTTEDGAISSVVYSYQDQAGWHQEPIDDQSAASSDQSLAFDSLGGPHVVYIKSNNIIQYASRTAAGWVRQKVADSGWDAYLTIGPKDQVEIAVWIGNPTSLIYFNLQDNVQRPVSANISDQTNVWEPITILMDPSGNIDFLYLMYDNALKFVQIGKDYTMFLPVIQK